MKTGIVAFAFGSPGDIPPNRRIALLALQKAREFKAPVFTQKDVPISKGEVEAYFAEEKQGSSPPSTLKIAKEAVEWAKFMGIKKILIIGAPPHLKRCARDIREVIFKKGLSIETQLPREAQKYPEGEWFSLDSLQVRTRTLENWRRREDFLRLLPFFIYNLITG